MKNLNIYIIILLIGFSVIKLNAQEERNVIWVHGYDGDISSWEHYERIFTAERQIISHRQGYNTGKGLDFCANQVIAKVDSDLVENATHPRNIAIGHSMGGLTIRNVDRITGNNKRFGGIITVDSPNYGAPIANSVADGSVEKAYQHACNQLSAGPGDQLFPLPWVIEGNITNEYLCNIIKGIWVVDALYKYPDTRSDLKVGSVKVGQINSYTTTIPRISIWAQENSPVHWRLAGTAASDEDNDQDVVDEVQRIKEAYVWHYESNRALGIANLLVDPMASQMFFKRAKEWKKGIDWINSSETIWNALIKTTRNETYTYSYWEYKCIYVDPNAKDIPYPGDDECEWLWVLVYVTQTVAVNYPSDGFVPEYTQKLRGIPGSNIYDIKGANHLEVRNMSKSSQGDLTKIRFNEIWDRRPGDFFRTDRRP